jgi:hypothetical protein
VRGRGRVTNTSRVWLKATNIGIMGNAFPTLSNDPSAQWPGRRASNTCSYWGLWVGAAIPGAATPNERYRVSQSIEWRPPTLEAEDRIYTSYDGAPNGPARVRRRRRRQDRRGFSRTAGTTTVTA